MTTLSPHTVEIVIPVHNEQRVLAASLRTLMHLKHKGRGLALRAAWGTSNANVVAYMDVDLSTDLDGLAELLEPLLGGRTNAAIGSRLAPGAQVKTCAASCACAGAQRQRRTQLPRKLISRQRP